MKARFMLAGVSLVALLGATDARAQTATDTYEWTRRFTANAFAGVATAPGDTGAAAGAGVGWGVARRWIVEGSGTWFDRPGGAEAFAATLTAQVMLSERRPVLPYLEAGFGMYAATFDTSRVSPPAFYARRFGDGNGGPAESRQSFRDPSIVVGGGMHVLVGRNFGLRPEVKATIVLDGGHTYVVTAVAMRLAYHIEPRAITPDRR